MNDDLGLGFGFRIRVEYYYIHRGVHRVKGGGVNDTVTFSNILGRSEDHGQGVQHKLQGRRKSNKKR